MTHRFAPSIPFLLLGGVFMAPGAGQGQDVEMLGREYGTRPPAEYYETRARFRDAFTFGRAWKGRLGGGIGGSGGGLEPGGELQGASADRMQAVIAATLGPREGTVEGDIAFPVLLGRFADTDSVAFDRDRVRTEFFDGPNSRFRTIPEYYEKISGGRVRLDGVTHDWVASTLTQDDVAGGVSGLGGSSRVGEFIVQLLVELDDGSVDWGRFDNDGPDGVPNSADDDGYVDVIAVIHPTHGAECGGADRDDRIWSHRWQLRWAAGQEYVTSTPSNSAENESNNVKIDDYTIQPLLSCDASSINEIGVMAHELGHGFGLPDLYCTADGCGHAGAGTWGLMGSGSWGCRGGKPSHPCHMTAWSKAVLGWADVMELSRDEDLGTLTLPAVETSGTVHRVEAGDGSGEYFLVENRQIQADGFDDELYAPGLLVWQVDPDVVAQRWPSNSINNDPTHLGVWLRQADGLDELASGGGRGDAGDPFPGSTGQDVFHASSSPASFTHAGRSAGVTLLDIAQGSGQEMSYRVLTRYQAIDLAVQGADATDPFLVDGAEKTPVESVVRSAPFEEHVFEAAPGQKEAEGVRIAFQGWDDGAPRIRDFTTGLDDTTLVAVYEGRQLQPVALVSPVEGVSPGTVRVDPGTEDGWVPEGSTVTVSAEPRTGFDFVEWGGSLEGSPNPTELTVNEPLSATAVFEKTFAPSTPSRAEVRAAVEHRIVLEAENANAPVEWRLIEGSLPEGMSFEEEGLISGVALELGVFPLTLQVRDAIGLEATAGVTLDVQDPGFSVETLTGPFLLREAGPDEHQRAYLDRNGNGNERYDLGDLRAYVLATPELVASGQLPERIRLLVPAVDMEADDESPPARPPGGGGDGGGGP